jgi:ATP-binding cassette subfamily F protein uup
MAEPNVLLLDEPTNDLDIDTLQQLEDLLDSWAGTLVVISHDRYLIERICDSTWALFGDGALTNLPGGIEQYLRRRREIGSTAARPKKSSASEADSVDVGATASAVATPTVSAAEHREARKTMNRLERQMDQLTKREEKLHVSLAEAATDPERLQELNSELRQVVADKEAAEAEWLDAAEKVE